MSIHKPQWFLLAYDIADPPRLIRVHRTCRQWGIPIQYSVYLVPRTPAGIGDLVDELRRIIDERVDDIRVYPLPACVEVSQYGRQGLPPGIELVGGRFGGEKIAALAARSKCPKRRQGAGRTR